MTDYKAEQAQEIEVLESIYPEELTKISDTELTISITPEETNDDHPSDICLFLHVTYPENYPDQVPILSIAQKGDDIEADAIPWPAGHPMALKAQKAAEAYIPKEITEKFIASLNATAEESLGMAMVFTLASQLREDLTQHLANQESEKERQTQEARNKEHEAEERRFKGTKVTAETFMAWKIQFDVEMAANKEAEQASSGSGKLVKKDDKKKQTGRELFETDRTLAKSDDKMLEEGDVTIDASLFEREGNIESDEDDDDNDHQLDDLHLQDSD